MPGLYLPFAQRLFSDHDEVGRVAQRDLCDRVVLMTYREKDGKMCTVSTQYMETVKIGIREFRENLAGYLESDKPLAITRHGETLGFYIPAQKRSRKAELEAMRAAAKDLDEMIASWGATEDELMDEFKQIRRSAREKKRNAK